MSNPIYNIVLTDGQEFNAEVVKIDRINGNLRYKDENGIHELYNSDIKQLEERFAQNAQKEKK